MLFRFVRTKNRAGRFDRLHRRKRPAKICQAGALSATLGLVKMFAAIDGRAGDAGSFVKRCARLGLLWLAPVLALTGCTGFHSNPISYRIDSQYGVHDPQFRRSMGQLLGPGIVESNRVTALVNGDQFFPGMLTAIRGAQKTITFESYIYWSGDIGDQFTDAMIERAKAGVKIHVLLDWFGSGRIDRGDLDRMRAAGIEVEKYHPLGWSRFFRINHRDHRKLLIVDGRVGFTGGMGVADIWQGNADSKEHWRDTAFQLEGPAVGQMQAAFMDNWMKTRGAVLHGDEYFPELKPAGTDLAQVFISSPRDGVESVRLMYLLSIAAARKNIRLSSPYFVPGGLTMQALLDACQRGVNVEVILPGRHNDAELVLHASRDRWGELLKAGAKIYEYQPTMYHCKVMIVDDLWVSVGSANFDSRSFRLNDEANLNVSSAAFAAGQVKIFEADKTQSRPVTLEEWRNRSFCKKLWGRFTRLFRSQL